MTHSNIVIFRHALISSMTYSYQQHVIYVSGMIDHRYTAVFFYVIARIWQTQVAIKITLSVSFEYFVLRYIKKNIFLAPIISESYSVGRMHAVFIF